MDAAVATGSVVCSSGMQYAGPPGHRAVVKAACGLPVIEPCQAAAALALQAVVAARGARLEAAA